MTAKLIKDRLFLKKIADNYTLHRIKDGILTIEGDSHYTIKGIHPFYKLSLKNCQAIERGYDLDELFNDVDKSIDYHEFDFTSFRLGFQKALEILGDKKFSEQDMRKAYKEGYYDEHSIEVVIQSLQQTEWDVEIEMSCVIGCENLILNGENSLCCGNKQPNLDADGCLILKRI